VTQRSGEKKRKEESMNPLIPLKAIAILLVTLTGFALLPISRAVTPPPDGGYPGNNTAEGEDALFSLTSGSANTAVGFNALFSNTSGGANTASGHQALPNNTIGNDNTATGFNSLFSNTTGSLNTATGAGALGSNTTGSLNTATGWIALSNNSGGSANTANGSFALFSNTSGSNNTADGTSALYNNSTGSTNTATGVRALYLNNADNNTANGFYALFGNTTGTNNTASGIFGLIGNTTGGSNTAAGDFALYANTTGSGNIALGTHAGFRLTTGDNNIDIGNQGARDESNTIRIGTQGTQTKTFIAGISDAAIGGMEVRVNQNGRLGTVPSSKRFKEMIKPMDKASECILALKPVTFRYKKEIDAERTPQFGLAAEDVEKVNPDLVARDRNGAAYSVRYDQVNAMLLNEFLKEHRTIQEQQKEIAALRVELKEQRALIQKVSAQFQVNKTVPQIVLNNQ